MTPLFQAVIGETATYRAAHGASAASVRTLFDILNNANPVVKGVFETVTSSLFSSPTIRW